MTVTIKNADYYKVEGEEERHHLCLGAKDNSVVTFKMRFSSLAEVNVTAEAKITDATVECAEAAQVTN